MYYGCGRIVIVITEPYQYYGGTTGYILGEKRRKWLVKTANNLELLVVCSTLTRPINPNTNRETYRWEFENDSYKEFKFFVEEWYPIQMLITKQNDYTYLTYLIHRYVQKTANCGGSDVVKIDKLSS